jgi:hypothetical protein
MKHQFLYGGEPAEVESAASVRGILIRSVVDGTIWFRVYRPDGQCTDYELLHDDLSITIDADALAAFYAIGERRVLDHSPSVLGLTEVP